MAKYQIPKSPGEFRIQKSKAGTPMIWNSKKSKGRIVIPCRDQEHANEVLEKLRNMKGGGELWI